MSKVWFEYPIVVPFGNPNFDAALGGSHDIDIGAPANAEITALLDGTISSIDSPSWGMQVGVKLHKPYNGIPYCSYLHLSAVKPGLKVGDTLKVGDLIGWCGGGTHADMYAGTSNPTGHNFLNDSFNSSRIQAGFALMRGPSYGHAGWENFPPVDKALDPTQIILDAVRALNPSPVDVAMDALENDLVTVTNHLSTLKKLLGGN